MPKTSIKTFLILIHRLNDEIDDVINKGNILNNRIQSLELTSVADIDIKDQLDEAVDEMGKTFNKLLDMKETLLGGLHRKMIDEMNAKPLNSRIKSLSLRRSAKSNTSRKTLRAKSI